MSITMTKAMLKVAVQGLSMVAPHKPTKTVFGCVRITAKDGKVKMLAMDLEQWVEYRNDGVETVGENDFLFKLAELKDLLKLPISDDKLVFEALPEGKVTATIQINGQTNTREYHVPAINEFPEAPMVDSSPLAVGPEFFNKLRLALPMTSKDKVNPTTNCISIKDGQIVATNRRELIVLNYELGVKEPILLPPPKVLSLLDTSGTVAVKGDQVEMKSGMWRTLIKQAPGKFPEFQQIVPKPSTLVTQFTIGDNDRATLLNTLGKLKINETHEPMVLYGGKEGIFALAGLNNPTVIKLADSKFTAEKPDLPLFYTLSKQYLLDALRPGLSVLRSADGHLIVAQAHNNKLSGYLIIMSLAGRFSVDQITGAVNKSIPHQTKTEDKTMPNENNALAKSGTQPAVPAAPAIPTTTSASNEYKVVESSAPADAFANLNASMDKLHNALYTLSTCVNEIVKQVRETQRNVKQRDRSFRDLQATIDRFKKVANF